MFKKEINSELVLSYFITILQYYYKLFISSQVVQNTPTHVEKRISKGIAHLNSSSEVLLSSAVQATAQVMHSPTNLYPWLVKCSMSLEMITPGTIHSSLPQMSSGVKKILDSMHFIHDMKTPSLKISLMNKLWGKCPRAQQQGAG